MVRRPARQSALAHAPRRAVPDSRASRAQPGRAKLRLAVDALAAHDAAVVRGPSCARPASLLPPPAPSSSRLTHPVDTSLSAVPATRSSHPSASRAAIDATPVCREGTHACREMEGGVVARMQKRPRPLLPPPRQPPLFPGQNRLTCTCQAQNAKTRRRRPRARSARCAAPAVTRPYMYRHLGPS